MRSQRQEGILPGIIFAWPFLSDLGPPGSSENAATLRQDPTPGGSSPDAQRLDAGGDDGNAANKPEIEMAVSAHESHANLKTSSGSLARGPDQSFWQPPVTAEAGSSRISADLPSTRR